ncbi:MAG: hypothetical protein ACLFQG_04395, partial [Desulfovermiculus sp.]
MALIPVPEQTTISPQYNDNTLELSFDPPVPSLQLPPSSHDQLIRDMKISSDSQGAHSLRLVFTQDVRFLVSRPKAHIAQVSLIPAKDAQADTKSDLKKPADPELKDIDFQTADNGDLLVQLTATSSFDYRLREGKKNALHLFFPDLHVPSKFIRLYNLSKFEATVSSALLTTTQDGAELALADLDDPVPGSWNGKTLTLRIPAAQSHGQSGNEASGSAASNSDASSTPFAASNSFNDQRHLELFPGKKEEYTGSPISLDLQDADIKHVLRLISEVGDYNLILDESVSGTISLQLEKVPW